MMSCDKLNNAKIFFFYVNMVAQLVLLSPHKFLVCGSILSLLSVQTLAWVYLPPQKMIGVLTFSNCSAVRMCMLGRIPVSYSLTGSGSSMILTRIKRLLG